MLKHNKSIIFISKIYFVTIMFCMFNGATNLDETLKPIFKK